jgi:hypothetical protein
MATTLPQLDHIGQCRDVSKMPLPFHARQDPVRGLVFEWEAVNPWDGTKALCNATLGDPEDAAARYYKSQLGAILQLMRVCWAMESERNGLIKERDEAAIRENEARGQLNTAQHQLTEMRSRMEKLKRKDGEKS